jgi:purine nucleosidase
MYESGINLTQLNHLLFPTGTDARLPVLLDTDIGTNVDDLLALLLTLGSPQLELVGVTTVYGDTALRVRVARSVLEFVGRADVLVGVGIETPLSGKPVFWTGHEG